MRYTFTRILPISAVLVVAMFFTYNYSNQNKLSSEQQDYIDFIENHPYANRDMTQQEYEELPKFDRPDLAAEHNFLQVVDPKLKRIPTERLVRAFEQTKNRLKSKSIDRKTIKGVKDQKNFSLTEEFSPSKINKSFVTREAIPDVSWVERGPDNIGGRTRTLMWDPNDSETRKVWAGATSGGIWFNDDITDQNSRWIAVNDFLGSLAISKITYDPNNTQIFYAGTGEGYIAGNGGGGVPGAGLYKSINGGDSWELLESTTGSDFRYIQDVEVTQASTIIITTRESINEGGAPGIYRSIDGGITWDLVVNGRGADLELANNGDIYASTGIASGVGNLLRSTDDGVTWSNITPPITDSGANPQRIEIAIAPSQSDETENTRIYAVAESSANSGVVAWFQRSDDGGENWVTLNVPNYIDPLMGCQVDPRDFTRGQASYDLILSVKPNNPSLVLLGGIDILRSTTAGGNMSDISSWTGGCDDLLHADQHEQVFRPGFPDEAILGNDGGVYYSSNVGVSSANPTFNARNNGYNVTQFYAVATDNVENSGYFLAGAQDNGTPRLRADTGQRGVDVTTGDGAFCHIDQTDNRFQTASVQFNAIFHSSNGGASFQNLTPQDNTLGFINPTDLDNESHILYQAGIPNQYLRMRNINSANPSAQENIGANVGRISHIRANAFEENRIFVGSRQGSVFRIDNADGNAPIVNNITGNIGGVGNVSSIDLGATDDQIIVTYSNFGVSSVWITLDGGQNWINKDEAEHGLPDIPIRWALFNPNNTGQVLLATELGIWSTNNIFDENPSWEPTINNLANVRCDMLQYREVDGTVVVGTFGRGIFTTNAFSTSQDATPPSIVSLFPEDNTENFIYLDTTLTISFSEGIVVDRNNGQVEIRRLRDDSLFESFNLLGSNITIGFSEIIFDPINTFELDTEYYVFIGDNTISDNNGNNFQGILENSSWNFTIFDGDFPPIVSQPVADMRFVIDDNEVANHEIDLTNVFSDVDNDDNDIAIELVNVDNPSLLSGSLSGRNLTLTVNPGMIASTEITIRGTSNGKSVDDTFIVLIADEVLFSQLDNGQGNGIISQQLTDQADSIVQSADDFIVRDGEIWDLTFVTVAGFGNTQTIDDFRVEIYGDNNGAPNENDRIFQQEYNNVGFEAGQNQLLLPVQIQLSQGKYWLSVLAISPIDGGRWNWFRREPQNEGEFHLIDRLGFFDGVTPGIWQSGGDLSIGQEDCIFFVEGDRTVITAAPSSLLVNEIANGQIEITWSESSDNETGFAIERSTNNRDFEEIAITESDITSFIDTDAESNTDYYYRVRALSTINSAYTEVVNVLTLPSIPILGDIVISGNVTVIRWATEDNARTFQFDISTDDFETFVDGFENFEIDGELFLRIEDLEVNQYQYRIRAVNASGASPNSEVGTIGTVTSVDETFTETFEFNIYPNPSSGTLTVRIPDDVNGELNLRIYSLNGSTVLTQKVSSFEREVTLSIGDYENGLYILSLGNEDNFSRGRFTKID